MENSRWINRTKTNLENDTYLPSLEYLDLEQFLDNDIPVICMLGSLCAFGLFGNTHAFGIFRSFPNSPVTTLILWMIVFDLITSVICIPLEFVQIRYTYTYPSEVLCKVTRYFTHFSSLASGTLLISIAIERRQKICVLQGWQLSINGAKYLGIIVTVLCALTSAPAAVYYNLEDRNTTFNGVIGKGCRNPKGFLEAKLYAGFVLFMISCGFILCTVAYIQIVNVIRRQIKTEKSRSSPYYQVNLSSRLSSEGRGRSDSVHEEEEFSTLQKRKTRNQRYKDSRKTTIMLLIATCVSFTGYILHISAIIIKTTVKHEKFQEIQSVYSIIVRGYFLHSAIHPIVYFVVDEKFRNEFTRIYVNLSRCVCMCFE